MTGTVRALLRRHRCRPWWEHHHVWCYPSRNDLYLVRYGWKGYPVDASVLPDCPRDFWARLHLVEKGVTAMLERKAELKSSVNGYARPNDPDGAKKWPTLWDHLTQTAWSDGEERRTTSFTFFYDRGLLRIVAHERNEERTLWAAAPTLLGLLAAIDAALRSDTAEWRYDRDSNGGKGGRVKKSS